MDLAELWPSFDKLRLQPSSSGAPLTAEPEPPRFHPFPRLPLELRLKIWERAQPAPRTIHLNTHAVVADPAFGLYLSFSLPAPQVKLFSSSDPAHPNIVDLQQRRAVSLLGVNHESRTSYLFHHPIVLPSGNGKLRLSHKDLLYISNFQFLIRYFTQNIEIRLCITSASPSTPLPGFPATFHTQDWVKQLSQIALPLECLGSPHFSLGLVFGYVKLFTALDVVKVVAWEHGGGGTELFETIRKNAEEKLGSDGKEKKIKVELMNLEQ